MLRRLRILIQGLCFAGITWLFLDFSGLAQAWLGWLAKAQAVPAILSLNLVAIAVIAAMTLLFGRLYCSTLCPLGAWQDIVSRLRKKRRIGYAPAWTRLRWGVFAVFIAAFFAGGAWAAGQLDPYSIYGRIATQLFAPLYRWGNNALAFFAERADSYAFYPAEVYWKGAPVFLAAVVLWAVVSVMAWRRGRLYCNAVCPVGTFLGVFSRFALWKVRIDTNACVGCGVCARKCKAACIDPKRHEIDYSRCVACMDCLTNCSQKAIRLEFGFGGAKTCKEPAGETPAACANAELSRREFLSIAPFLAAAAATPFKKDVDGGLAPERAHTQSTHALLPPGARGERDFARRCTACQLCVAACPNGILQPSRSADMRPELNYARGYCPTNCTRCGEVCPTGAIRPVTAAEKASLQVGRAVWTAQLCVVNVDGVQCDNCAAHCPAGAILMVPKDSGRRSLKIPTVDAECCVGCGKCEYLCPASPTPAIRVEAVAQHREV